MDKRIIFLAVFIFTLISTILVAAVSMMTNQGILTTVLYALSTMWLTGIVSQLLFHSLYLNIVKPAEEAQLIETLNKEKPTVDYENSASLQEVLEKEQILKLAEEKEAHKSAGRDTS